MTVNATAVYRVRAGGSNTNGGGYDASITGTLSTTLNGSISSGATTVVVTSATGWPGSGNYYARIGTVGAETASGSATGTSEVVLVTGGQGTTSWTVTRGQLGTTAQAFATAVVVDNELSRCNTAIATGTTGTSNASTTFTDTVASAFNLTDVGNFLYLASGTNGTVSAYCITAFTNSTTITLDRNCSTGVMVNGAWKIGGGWASPQTNLVSSTYNVPGSTVYIRGAGTDAPSSDDYALAAAGFVQLPSGDTTNGYTRIIGENGRPRISCNSLIWYANGGGVSYRWFENLYLVATGTTNNDNGLIGGGFGQSVAFNCVCDQNGYDQGFIGGTNVGLGFNGGAIIQCEAFSSVAPRGTQVSGAINIFTWNVLVAGCNVHDTNGPGIVGTATMFGIENCIVANCRKEGIIVSISASTNYTGKITGCTITGNGGNGGIRLTDLTTLQQTQVINNILANHASASQGGIYYAGTGTNAQAARLQNIWTNNVFYNNTANVSNGGSAGWTPPTAYGNISGTDPGFVSPSTENFTPGVAMYALALQMALNHLSGKVSTTDYSYVGAIQPAAGAGGSGMLFIPNLEGT